MGNACVGASSVKVIDNKKEAHLAELAKTNEENVQQGQATAEAQKNSENENQNNGIPMPTDQNEGAPDNATNKDNTTLNISSVTQVPSTGDKVLLCSSLQEHLSEKSQDGKHLLITNNMENGSLDNQKMTPEPLGENSIRNETTNNDNDKNKQVSQQLDTRNEALPLEQMHEFVYLENLRLKAEPARLIMRYSNIPYNEKLISSEDWPQYKEGSSMDALPILKVAEGDLCQPLAVARYLSRKAGLLGTNNWDAARIDMLMDGFLELLDNLKPVYSEPNDGIRGDLWRQSKEDVVAPFLRICSKFLDDNVANKYFVGEAVSWADLAIGDFLNTLRLYWDPSLLDDFVNLRRHVDNIVTLPGIQKYILERPAAQI